MAAREETISEFGLITAYLVPGATVLLGFSQFLPSLRMLFLATDRDMPTIGGFLYLTVGAFAVVSPNIRIIVALSISTIDKRCPSAHGNSIPKELLNLQVKLACATVAANITKSCADIT